MRSYQDNFELVNNETFRRIDTKHPLGIYTGKDENAKWTLLIISEHQPRSLRSSKMITITKGRRKDNNWALSFSLSEEAYKEIFILFCGDIIESSRNIRSSKQAISFVCSRYQEWRDMLANSKGKLLEPCVIKGLIGELYFLKNYLSNIYSPKKAVNAWTGPKQGFQDFIIDDTWYEIKTIVSTKTDVQISSIEQLDCSNEGELVVIKADKTSIANEKATSINILYNEILNLLQDDDIKIAFSNTLLQVGYYPTPAYETEDYIFEIKGVTRYSVTQEFPCLRRSFLPDSILSSVYNLSLSVINTFRKD